MVDMKSWKKFLFEVAALAAIHGVVLAEPWLSLSGGEGPGHGKHIVLISGDEEYRSEEALPMLGKILAERHGFDCTVLFAIDPETGEIAPNLQTNIPGLEHLRRADLMILATRFRDLPEDQMRWIAEYVEAGKPILGLRTATHAFQFTVHADERYGKYDWRSEAWPGGFGRQILGDTWINHHGHHGEESTRGLINPARAEHPILNGVVDVWCPTDVYGIRNLTDAAKVLVYGLVLDGMEPNSPPVTGPKNAPMMPVAWINTYTSPGGATGTAFCTTMGASVDLQSEDLRRLLVNATYWLTGLRDAIPSRANVDIVGDYDPSFFGFNQYRRGLTPETFRD